MEYALSTMWGVKRFTDLGPFFVNGEKAGFTCFELNHGVNSSMLVGLEGRKIQSVHEPCPADISTTILKKNDWLVSSLHEEKRKKGVESVMRSIDLAAALGAAAVVVHPGHADSGYDSEDRMRQLFAAGAQGGGEYAELLEMNREARARTAPFNLEQVAKSLDELAGYAFARGIVLGLENRYHFHEFPSPDELAPLLEIGPPGTIGFWYDVGHAETMSRLGFFPRRDWLDRFASKIVGAHFHDLSGVEDHHYAGDGTLPWEDLVGRIPSSALRTCEFRNSCGVEEIARGREFLEALGI